jgi:hypothetical protein
LLPQRWTHAAQLPALKAAYAALDDSTSGSAAWRALGVPSDPFAKLTASLPAGMRVVLLSVDEASGDAYASAVGMVSTEPPPPVDPKAKGPPPELPPPKLLARVARVKGAAARVAALAAEAEEVRAAQSKAALQDSKDAIFAMQPGTAAAATKEAAAASFAAAMAKGAVPEGTLALGLAPASYVAASAAEGALRSLVTALDALFGPLLAPLLPLLGAEFETGGGDALSVVLIADGALAALPLELMTPLRQPNVKAVSRDLSTALLAKRLSPDPAAAPAAPVDPKAKGKAAEPAAPIPGVSSAKRSGFLAAVDPRVEVMLPPPPNDAAAPVDPKAKGKDKKAAAAPAEGADGGPRTLCAAFRAEVLDGARVAFGKEWRAGASIIGVERVPSLAEWQRLAKGCAAFVYEGPGALYEQVEPSTLAPLALGGCAA